MTEHDNDTQQTSFHNVKVLCGLRCDSEPLESSIKQLICPLLFFGTWVRATPYCLYTGQTAPNTDEINAHQAASDDHTLRRWFPMRAKVMDMFLLSAFHNSSTWVLISVWISQRQMRETWYKSLMEQSTREHIDTKSLQPRQRFFQQPSSPTMGAGLLWCYQHWGIRLTRCRLRE